MRTALRWPFPSEDIVVPSDDGVQLLVRASWQPRRTDRRAIVFVHGLEGSDRAGYLVSTGIHAFRRGWDVIRMNMRGCGDSLDLCPRLYNAGLTTDLVAVARWLASRTATFAIVGFSLGAGLSLLTLAKERRELPPQLASAVAICPPLDMSRSADALEWRKNWYYGRRFTRSLCASYRARQARSRDRYERGREKNIATLREFDDIITAHYGHYRDAADYYDRVSAGPRLSEIETPTLVLSSTNDPFIPIESVSHWPVGDSVRLELTEGAGHVGFVGRSSAPRFFWASERALDFIEMSRS